MLDLNVIIPAYREAENLETLLPAVVAAIGETKAATGIIVVDSETPLDGTEDICRRYQDAGVRHVRRSQGPSFGSAIRSGIAVSEGRHVIFIDADGSHDPAWIPKLYARRDDADVVVASRYIEGGETANPWLLRQMSLMVNVAYRLVLSIDCRDVSNNFKLYDGDQLRAVELKCENFDTVEEILVKMKWRNPDLRILEIPSAFRERMRGTTKRNLLAFAGTFLITLIRLRFSR